MEGQILLKGKGNNFGFYNTLLWAQAKFFVVVYSQVYNMLLLSLSVGSYDYIFMIP